MGLERWNQDRPDAPEEFKNQKAEEKSEKPKSTRKKKTETPVEEVAGAPATEEAVEVEEAPKKRRGRPKKVEAEPSEE